MSLSVSNLFQTKIRVFSVRLYFTLTVESIHPCHCLVLPFTFPETKKTDGAVQLLTPQLLRPPHGGLRVVYLQRVRLHQGRGGAEREGAGALRAGRFQVRERDPHTHTPLYGTSFSGTYPSATGTTERREQDGDVR